MPLLGSGRGRCGSCLLLTTSSPRPPPPARHVLRSPHAAEGPFPTGSLESPGLLGPSRYSVR